MARNAGPASSGISGRHGPESAALVARPTASVLQAIRLRPRLQLYSSPVLLEELTDVLTRPAAMKQLTAIGKAARDVPADYLDAIEPVEPVELPHVVREPDDDHVLACALAARARPQFSTSSKSSS